MSMAGGQYEVLPDGGPPTWAMAGPLGHAPGLQIFSHCWDAARAIGDTASRLLRTGELQHRKAYAIMYVILFGLLWPSGHPHKPNQNRF